MSAEFDNLIKRMLKNATNSAQSGYRILHDRDMGNLDVQSIRNAATQFRQAAKELDELDGMLQAYRALEK